MPRRGNNRKFLANTNTKEVHDLDNEQTNCQINEIISAGHDVYYDTLQEAHNAGYDNGHWCIGDSKR